MPNPDLHTFALELGKEACELAAAPALKPPDREVTVVTDPHFNALVAHEIIGHPCEADRALKMEAAYAGRSWLLRSLKTMSSAVRSARDTFGLLRSALDGYGHYLYDHEGTPGRRMMHIEAGVFRGFLNSRATAAALGVEPNGSSRASEARHVPLIRMSNTFFMPGESDPPRSSRRSSTATTCAATGFPRSPNRARTSVFRPAKSMKSKTAGWAGSIAPAA